MSGRVTVRAVRIAAPIVLDGALTDEVYRQTEPINGFIQQEPHEGQPASNQTDVWLLFDDRSIYIGARCWTLEPARIVANEMRRDGFAVFQNDNFGVFLDTFHDRRNGVFFFTNALAAVSEQLITDERETNRDWNTVWDVRTGRFDQGWTVEMTIPFRSLRYPASGPQVWGVQFRRVVRGANESSYLTPMAAAFTQRAIVHVSQAAALVGLEAPPAALNLELKPFGLAKVETDLEASLPFRNDPGASAGLDAKYTFPNGLVADATLNTDFAQVEDDEQQVNLTRFSLFFPERREFFLEGAGIFAFGGASVNPRGGPAGPYGPPSNTPILFYSRRIGLFDVNESESVSVPILAGGRLTGRTGAYTIGMLDIQQREAPAVGSPPTNFSVLRVKRDVFTQSSIGFLVTNRSRSVAGSGSSQTFGVDAGFTFLRDLIINAYYARTHGGSASRDRASYRADVEYNGDRYGFQAERLAVERNFNPELGHLRREDFRRTFGQARFSPRPADSKTIRKYLFEASFDRFTDTDGRLETEQAQLTAGLELQKGDECRLELTDNYEVLEEPFPVLPGTDILPGAYRFVEAEARYQLGPQRKITGMLTAGGGQFYGGMRRQIGYRGRIELSPRIGIEPGVSVNWMDLGRGFVTTKLVTARFTYTISPRTAFSTFVQYNSAENVIGANLRFRWEYRPGSDLYVVYNDGRDTSYGVRRAGIGNQTLAVKISRLVRF